MKYVHVFTGQESADVDEGALHWPWVAPDRVEVHDRVARARTAAREEVAKRIATGTVPAGSTVSSRRLKGAKATVRRSRNAAARTAAAATSSSAEEAGGNA